jgi:ATP-dependent Lhr-like helicase
VLTSEDEYAYLGPGAADVLRAQREEVGTLVDPRVGGVEVVADEIRWWTFAGGRINSTLRYALEAIGTDWKVVPDNYAIKLRGEGLSRVVFEEILDKMREVDFRENAQLWQEVAHSLPNYRLSKFQPLMPPWVEREVVASYLLDVASAWDWLTQGEAAELERVPAGIASATEADEKRLQPLERIRAARARPLRRDAGRSIEWVTSDAGLARAAEALASAEVIGLDVETSMANGALSLLQLAGPDRIYLVDALQIDDFSDLAPLLSSQHPIKLIHNAKFERAVLGQYGLALDGVVDTITLSRRKHPEDGVRHDLRSVCERELGYTLDKTAQKSDWTRRPLRADQIEYAALDAEVLLPLHPLLMAGEASTSSDSLEETER